MRDCDGDRRLCPHHGNQDKDRRNVHSTGMSISIDPVTDIFRIFVAVVLKFIPTTSDKRSHGKVYVCRSSRSFIY